MLNSITPPPPKGNGIEPFLPLVYSESLLVFSQPLSTRKDNLEPSEHHLPRHIGVSKRTQIGANE